MSDYHQEYSWGWLKERWPQLSVIGKIECTIRTICVVPVTFVMRYYAFSIMVGILLAVAGFSSCDGNLFSLTHNSVNQSDAEVIVEAASCAWSDKMAGCYCIYANGGAISFHAPDQVCQNE